MKNFDGFPMSSSGILWREDQAGAPPAVGPRFRRAPPPQEVLTDLNVIYLASYLGFHILLTAAAKASGAVATVWAFGAIAYAFHALRGADRDFRITRAVMYIAAAEVTWRGTHASVLWETGKYSVIVFLAISYLSRNRYRRLPFSALLFLLCFLPSMTVLPGFDRRELAFNLAGPLALGVAVVFFSNVHFTLDRVRGVFVAMLGPIVGLAGIAAFGLMEVDREEIWVGGKVTTAGIGSNQVSTTLGLGILLVFFLLVFYRHRPGVRWMLAATGFWLLAQNLLSLSRGGFWAAILGIAAGGFFLARTQRIRRRGIAIIVGSMLAVQIVIIPGLDAFTSDMVSNRYSSFDATGREKIAHADLKIFLANPVFGVGPGQSYYLHAMTHRASSAHTEFSRLAAEHGIFGLLAIAILTGWLLQRARARKARELKALAVGLTIWGLATLGHSATRTVAPSLMIGFGGAFLASSKNAQSGRRLPPGGTRGAQFRQGSNMSRYSQAALNSQ